MARHSKLITLDEFKKKCSVLFHSEDEGEDPEFDPYELPAKIKKDISKIDFDMENWGIGNADHSFSEYPSDCSYGGYPAGYDALDNGMPLLFVNAGGDWEHPICFCIYWSGTELRGYVPKDGNVYNHAAKAAFGSDDDEDESDTREFEGKTYDIDELPDGDPVRIKADIIKRIILKI